MLQYNTKNLSFLKMYTILKDFGIKNNDFFLELKDESLLKKFYESDLKDYFELKSKDELLDEHILGYGTPHKMIDSFLGNYFLLAKKEYMLNDSSNDIVFKGHHAGISDDETNLFMMIFNN